MIDWRDTDRIDDWRVDMVDPNDLSRVLGSLSGVTALSLDLGYYADTRAGAKVETLGDDGYVANSMLRIVHSVASWGYTEPLFTGFVTGAEESVDNGTRKASYTLSSALYGVGGDLFAGPFTMGVGGTTLQAVDAILKGCGRPYRLLLANDYRFTSARMWEAASSKLSALFDIVNLASDRLSVDGEGYVTVEGWSAPSAADEPDWVLDAGDRSAVTLGDDAKHSTTAHEVPGRYIVTHKDGDALTIGTADVAAGSAASASVRGYTLTETRDVTDLPGGQAQADQLAAQYLAAAQAAVDEWSVTCLYMPLREGDRVLLRLWGEDVRGFVKDASFDLLKGTVDLTVKGVA